MLAASIPRPAAKRPRKRGRRTRQHILDVSMHLFALNGYPGTTVRDIAREAGITDAAIYYHFRTKEDVLHELLGANLDRRRTRADGGDARALDETLRGIAQHAVAMIEGNIDLLRLILREALAGDDAAAVRYRTLLDRWEERVNARLRPFEQSGAIAAGAADELSRQVVYTIAMAVQDRLLLSRSDGGSRPAGKGELVSFLVAAIGRLFPAGA